MMWLMGVIYDPEWLIEIESYDVCCQGLCLLSRRWLVVTSLLDAAGVGLLTLMLNF